MDKAQAATSDVSSGMSYLQNTCKLKEKLNDSQWGLVRLVLDQVWNDGCFYMNMQYLSKENHANK